jgi:hypothetical protein
LGIRFFAATLVAASSWAATASDHGLDFNNLTLQYTYSERDNADGDGFGAELFYTVWDRVYLQTAYSSRELDFDNNQGSAEVDFLSFAAGYALPLVDSGKFQLFGGISYEMLDLGGQATSASGGSGGTDNSDGDTGGTGGPTGTPLDTLFCLFISCSDSVGTKSIGADGTGDTGGFGGHIGLRGEVYTNLEVAARYQYRVYDEAFFGAEDSEQILGLNLAYRFGQWAAVINYDNYDTFGFNEYYAGIRYDFAKE